MTDSGMGDCREAPCFGCAFSVASGALISWTIGPVGLRTACFWAHGSSCAPRKGTPNEAHAPTRHRRRTKGLHDLDVDLRVSFRSALKESEEVARVHAILQQRGEGLVAHLGV